MDELERVLVLVRIVEESERGVARVPVQMEPVVVRVSEVRESRFERVEAEGVLRYRLEGPGRLVEARLTVDAPCRGLLRVVVDGYRLLETGLREALEITDYTSILSVGETLGKCNVWLAGLDYRGSLEILLDAEGARITGGILVSRPAGGGTG